MTNISFVKENFVEITHYSTASVFEVTILKNDDEDENQSVWLDYAQMKSLIEAVKKFDRS
jgi:hypothetical protein